MKGLFSPDNVVVRFFVKLGYCWWLNILWLITSLPVITIGASTTALIYSTMKLHDDEGYVTKNYFKSFKENFKQSTLIWLIYLAVGAMLVIDMIYWKNNGYRKADGSFNILWAFSIALILLYGISFEWVFAIQSKFVNTVGNTIRYSFVLPFKHLKETILMLIMTAAVVYLNVATIFAVNFFTINLGIGLMAYVYSVYYINVFKKYIPAEPEIEDPAEFELNFDENSETVKITGPEE